MKIGLLTGGGDAPGLNGIIEACVKNLLRANADVVGIMDGFEGVFRHQTKSLGLEDVEGIHRYAGTVLGSTNKRGINSSADRASFLERYEQLGLDGLIVAGGDGTFRALSQVGSVPVLGIPKTIDNDLPGTDMTFGHHSACEIICRSLETLRHSADAHRRIMVLETMGRTAGWLALNAGLAGYADAILIPEVDFSLDKLSSFLRDKLKGAQRGLVICVSEGVKVDGKNIVSRTVEGSPEAIRLGGVSQILAQILENSLGIEARHVVLGHLQRSEPPSVYDRLLSLRLGRKIADMAINGQWNRALALRNGKIKDVCLSEFQAEPRTVSLKDEAITDARSLGIFL